MSHRHQTLTFILQLPELPDLRVAADVGLRTGKALLLNLRAACTRLRIEPLVSAIRSPLGFS